jgi:hypothetical protein
MIPLWLTLLGCPKEPLSSEIPDAPILPSPEAEMYALGDSTAKDPLVSRVSEDLPWDEALSGAAAGVGLNAGKGAILSQARWAAVVAGYPFSVEEIIIGAVEAGEYPKGLPDQLHGRSWHGRKLGLARVRKGHQDLWIALVADAGKPIPALAREYKLEESLQIDGQGSDWRLLSPEGEIDQGRLPLERPLGVQGEWWLELSRSDEVFASIPLYVGMGTPPTNLFSDFGAALGRPEDVEVDAMNSINRLREREGLPTFNEDGALSTLAELPLQQYLDGEWSRTSGEKRLQAAGFVGGPVYQFVCTGGNADKCLDQLSWSLDARAAFFNPGLRVIGLRAHVETQGMALILNLASE